MKPFIFLLSLAFFQSAIATEIKLLNGDTLNGDVIKTENGQVTLSHPILGLVTIPSSNIKPAVVSEEKIVDKKDNGLLGTGFFKDWKRSAELGINGNEGNTQDMDIHIGVNGDFSNTTRRWSVSSVYNNGSDDNETTKSDFFAQFTRDFLNPSTPHFSFIKGRYDWDEFEDWDHQIDLSAGVGSQLIKKDAWSLIGRTGLGVSKEFGGDNDDWTPEALLGLESFWAISKHHSVEFKNSLYPNLDKLGEFRNLTELNWKIGLADINNLNLKVGFVNDYDSLANGESQENDFQYRLLLAFDI
ncbi:YdiY family protein [Cycloclasticus sp. P1]|uniref:DUF481 domain-containing protein n=1 Tax=Cycloclasticus sp. (strain P1) TaxID=385025 RepID=UPI000286AE5C|nr:DUF481 domain-containing protein [Cycloclasticus sp. P1]AFT67020.1 hypothetical protein Q91_0982 [Cycloclasticus sp. P1]